jgi:hypothetical protein
MGDFSNATPKSLTRRIKGCWMIRKESMAKCSPVYYVQLTVVY